jgi:hypothetical protein
MTAREHSPLTSDEATGAGYDFAAIAGERELALHARYGERLANVEPIERAGWESVAACVGGERKAGLTLLRFAAGQEPWSAVEAAVRTVDDRRWDLFDVAPRALDLDNQRYIAADLDRVLASAGLNLSTF